MQNSLDLHRPTAIAAAVIMLLDRALDIGAFLSSMSPNTAWFMMEGQDLLIVVLLAVFLFRGKKDTAFGAALMASMMMLLLSMVWDFFSLVAGAATGYDQNLYFAYSGMSMLTTLLLAGFYCMTAVECLSQGKISTGRGRWLLWILPLIGFGCSFAANVLMGLYFGQSMEDMVFTSVLYVTLRWLGRSLMGVSFVMQKKTDV